MTPDDFQADNTVDYDNVDFGDGGDQFADTPDDAEDATGDDENAFDEQPETEAEADDAPEEDAEEVEAEEPESDEDGATVTLSNGETLSLAEVEKGLMLQADYTRKTTEVAKMREEVEQTKSRAVEHERNLSQSLQAAQSFIAQLLPPEPDYNLAQRDPQAYQREMALHREAKKMLETVTQAQTAQTAQQQQRQLQQLDQLRAQETERLVQVMPHLGNPEKMQAFMGNVSEVAKDLGFSDDEIATTGDHRVLQMVHLAGIGKRALENKKAAERRVASKPKAKAGKPAPVTNGQKNAAAMKRLQKTGSISDALKVDIEW